MEVVGKRINIRKVGREWEGCCPFHNEKSASFKINEDKQFYHCFGCGAHGDVIDFVAQHDGVDAAEAVRSLTGGKPPKMTAESSAERKRWLEAQEASRLAERSEAIEKARRRWNKAKPLEGANEYLERKKVAPHVARMEGDKLLLPIYGPDDELMSVQTIAPDGSKLFAPGAQTSLGVLQIGSFFGRQIICEGFATGASLFEALADQVCVTFSKGNMARVAEERAAQGAQFILAPDNNAAEEMLDLGKRLGVPVILPSNDIDDFNDMAVKHGVDAVARRFTQGLIDWNNAPKPVEPPYCDISFVDALDFDESAIPKRPWLIPSAILAGYTHILAAPGGTGKSLFTLQLALTLAGGTRWGRWAPKKKCRVLIINAEDDIHEQHRRLAAARNVMAIDTCALRGQIMIAENPSSILMTKMDEKKGGKPTATPLVEQLQAVIRHYGIDVVIVDPFAETFDGDENSNNDGKWAMKVWRDDVARATGCAVYLVHHTTKGAGEKAGNADAIRGAGALVNSARIAATLFVMTPGEAELLGVPEDERFRYVRYDDAKANQSLIGSRQWFEKISVVVGNGDSGDMEDPGDEVGALKPWEPNGLGGHGQETVLKFLAKVNDGYIDDDGIVTDMPFGRTSAGGSKRWIGNLAMQCFDVDEEKARVLLRSLSDKGLIEEYEYEDLNKGRTAKGMRAVMDVAQRIFAEN